MDLDQDLDQGLTIKYHEPSDRHNLTADTLSQSLTQETMWV